MRRVRDLRRDEGGQAMIYVAIVTGVLVTVLYATYELGRLVSAKITSQNSADASVLASVSLKLSVHHTRTLAYLAMTDEATLARMHYFKAIASLNDSNEAQRNKNYANEMKQMKLHRDNLEMLRHSLRAYNAWIVEAGPDITREAARIAFAANMAGMNSGNEAGSAQDTLNVGMLDDETFKENSGGKGAAGHHLDSSKTIGGVNYPAEGTGMRGNSGKSFVFLKPVFKPTALPFGKKLDDMALYTWAAAGPVPHSQIMKQDAYKGFLALPGGMGVPWYSPRLIKTGDMPRGSELGDIDSQH